MDFRPKAELGLLCVMLACGIAPARGAVPVMVQDYEQVSSLPAVWVVNIPNENASVQLTTDHPHDGKQCLRLHYHFLSSVRIIGQNGDLKDN